MKQNITIEELATGEVLRSLRKEKKLTLAEAGNSIGVGSSHLSQVERGRVGVSLPTLLALLQVLEIGKVEFMAKVEEMVSQLQKKKGEI